jgi:hypothetical protein
MHPLQVFVFSPHAFRRLVVVKGPGDVPCDLRIGRGTGILSEKQPVKLTSLNSDINRRDIIRLTLERSGDFVQSIQIQQ